MGGRGRGAREEINAKLDSNQKTTCVLCFFFYGGEKEGAVINGNRVWGPDTNSTQLMGKKAHREKKKNTKLRHAYIIIIIGYLTTSHSSTKECVTPFFLFSL